MTQESGTSPTELEDILHRLEEGRQALFDALEACDPQRFADQNSDGESIKAALERTADDLNFYYGRLVARAVSLPQPPCLQRADFGSLREATVSIQVAHRRLSNLLHDLLPADLERLAQDPEHGTYTLRQVLEMAVAHYRLRAQQVGRIAAQAAEHAG